MQVKKSAKADLESKKGLFLEVGLTVALLLTIFAFSWSQSEKVIETMDVYRAVVEEEVIDVTVQEDKPIEPPKQQTITVASDILQIVKDDVQVSTEIDFSTEFLEDVAVVVAPPAAVVEEVIEEDTPFITAEQMPTFQGGDINAFRQWVQSQLSYPTIAAENGITGRVTISFVVERDGSVGRIKVLASPDRSLSEEAMRVVARSPKWAPGKQRGNAVPVTYNLPVMFNLN